MLQPRGAQLCWGDGGPVAGASRLGGTVCGVGARECGRASGGRWKVVGPPHRIRAERTCRLKFY